MITELLVRQKDLYRERFDVRTNWASRMGHPCLRQLVYWRTRYREATPMSAKSVMRCEAGKIAEMDFIAECLRARVEVIRLGEPFLLDKYQVSGKIEGLIVVNKKLMALAEAFGIGALAKDFYSWVGDDRELLFEYKTIAHHSYPRINDEGDLYSSPNFWIRGYIAQMHCYMMAYKKDKLLFVLEKAGTHERKPILCHFVEEYMEKILKKALAINKHMKQETLPDRIKWHKQVCGWCDLKHICKNKEE